MWEQTENIWESPKQTMAIQFSILLTWTMTTWFYDKDMYDLDEKCIIVKY